MGLLASLPVAVVVFTCYNTDFQMSNRKAQGILLIFGGVSVSTIRKLRLIFSRSHLHALKIHNCF